MTGRTVTKLLVSRDGSRLVAVVRGRTTDRVVATRIRHDAAGGIIGFTPVRALPLPEDGSKRIRDIGWRTPTTISVLSDAPNGYSQVRTFSVDGAPGEVVTSGLTFLRGRIRSLVSAPVDGSDVFALGNGLVVNLTNPDRSVPALPEGLDLAHLRRLIHRRDARPVAVVRSRLLAWSGARRGPRPVPRQPLRRVRRARSDAVRPVPLGPVDAGLRRVALARARRAGHALGHRGVRRRGAGARRGPQGPRPVGAPPRAGGAAVARRARRHRRPRPGGAGAPGAGAVAPRRRTPARLRGDHSAGAQRGGAGTARSGRSASRHWSSRGAPPTRRASMPPGGPPTCATRCTVRPPRWRGSRVAGPRRTSWCATTW